ncbi:FAD-binding oxidoreductase [Amycolatopsis sp. FDAARGOS 1241]|uniref:FAD-binding oxidoreductase n=1 Tax=Amycolatopsis sp. FDAARGOS 1241 TaxID=2778070 RepID=UPI00194E6368|nr:FAD-dependent oxidoreductase [Amycolatopsis sp. FDAARGOS 1241]QRP46877.1 FAD-dependent oxidoreductase [Amycolatopsis sp. FDAARGOS 1241]
MKTFIPGQDGYAAATAGFQTGVRSAPELVVAAEGARDVAEAVRHANAYGLTVDVEATGHGRRTPAEGVLISTRRMTDVAIDPARATARVGAGTTWGAVIAAAAEHGLAPLSGSAPGVGVVGYTLGGGFSLLGRRYGLAADRVRSAEVVTTDGTIERTTDAGAGVVTALEFGLVSVTSLYGGGLYFDTLRLPDILRAWRDWTTDLPDALTTSLALIPYPDLPMVPQPLRGKHIAHVRVAHLGAGGPELAAPLRAKGPLVDTLTTMPFTESGAIAAEPPIPHAYLGDNRVVAHLPDSTLAAILEHAGPGAPVPTVLIIDLLGGAYAHSTAPDFTPQSRYTVRALSVVETTGPDPIRAAHAKLFDPLATTGRLRSFVYGQPFRPGS